MEFGLISHARQLWACGRGHAPCRPPKHNKHQQSVVAMREPESRMWAASSGIAQFCPRHRITTCAPAPILRRSIYMTRLQRSSISIHFSLLVWSSRPTAGCGRLDMHAKERVSMCMRRAATRRCFKFSQDLTRAGVHDTRSIPRRACTQLPLLQPILPNPDGIDATLPDTPVSRCGKDLRPPRALPAGNPVEETSRVHIVGEPLLPPAQPYTRRDGRLTLALAADQAVAANHLLLLHARQESRAGCSIPVYLGRVATPWHIFAKEHCLLDTFGAGSCKSRHRQRTLLARRSTCRSKFCRSLAGPSPKARELHDLTPPSIWRLE